MPEVYLASSALAAEDFESKRTIEEARKAGFRGVQLFLDSRLLDSRYRLQVISALKESELGLVLHLPNIVNEHDIHAAEEIVTNFPDAKVLVHYLPTDELPDIKGTKVGWENSQIGPMDLSMTEYLYHAKLAVNRDETFYVFDMGRLLYAPDDKMKRKAVDYIRTQIKRLDPHRDVIHLVDKTSWILKFRECMCVLGEGVMSEFMDDVKGFHGIVVFEHENLEMALKSLGTLIPNT